MVSRMTIGKLACEARVNVQTIRYYERLKLLLPSVRLPSRYRLYGPDAQQRLHFIKNAQALGFTLYEITDLLNLRLSSKAQCGDVLRKAQGKLKQCETKIQALQAMAQSLRRLIQACHKGLPTDHCPILQCLEESSKAVSRKMHNPTNRRRSR